MPEPAYLSPSEIAARLGLTKTDAVLGWIRSGELAAVNVSGGPGRPTWRIAEADLAEFLARRRAVPEQPRRVRRMKQMNVTSYF